MSATRTRDGRLIEDELDELRRQIAAGQAEIKFVGELAKVEYKPGDVFVLTTPHHLSDEGLTRLRKRLEDKLGSGIKVLVVDGGMKVGLIGGLANAG